MAGGLRVLGALTLIFALPCSAAQADPVPTPAGTQALVGALHDHSGYSDGWPGTRPADVFASAKGYGLDFMGISDHSENTGLPFVLSEACYGEGRGGDGELLLAECALADPVNPADSFRKWDATAEQGAAATSADFAAIRGFEWSSDRFGHLNVFFSQNWTSAYADGGFVAMETFWNWFTRDPLLQGGGDGLGVFNHPSAKTFDTKQLNPGEVNWNDFTYAPEADDRMVGIEVFNDTKEYGTAGYPEGAYAYALDKGWHLGAVGAEDLGHRKPPLDNWGGPEWGKTVMLATGRTAAEIRAAMEARRFYAIGPAENSLRLSYTVDGQPMGSRLERAPGASLEIAAQASDPDVTLELVTSGGTAVASGSGSLALARAADTSEHWYFIRVLRGSRPVAYSSPIWIES